MAKQLQLMTQKTMIQLTVHNAVDSAINGLVDDIQKWFDKQPDGVELRFDISRGSQRHSNPGPKAKSIPNQS